MQNTTSHPTLPDPLLQNHLLKSDGQLTQQDESNSTPTSNPLRTARSLVLLQLLSRLLTFGLNQALLRLASPTVFGTAAIQFDLICSSILFLSREGIRNALLRIKSSTSQKDKEDNVLETQLQSLSIVPLQLGIAIATILSSIYLYTSDEATTSQSHFHASLLLYIIASLMELSIEPLYIKIHRFQQPKLNVRVQAEGGMAILRSIVTVSSLIGFGEKNALLSFALGQIAGTIWLVTRYLREFEWDIRTLFWVKSIKDEKRFNPDTLSLAIANTGQSFIKHILTEADRIAVSRICPLDGQGGYAVAMNYGSLIARIVFQPLEESLLLHYSSSLSSPSILPLYTLTIRLSLYLTLIMRTFVPPLYPAISPFLLPKQYQSTTAPSILRLYLTTYIPLMSLNGVSESFVTSSASSDEIKKQARWMISSSGIFAITLFLLTHLPELWITDNSTEKSRAIGTFLLNPTKEESLILASCSAMLIRIIFSLFHAKKTFDLRKPNLRYRDLLPDLKIFIWTWIVWLSLKLLANRERWVSSWKGWIELVGLGGILGLITLGFIFLAERGKLKDLRNSSKGVKIE
ncbi:uncharacterized protein L201_005024 [Kwoniella dendrophila CBS 6074]|uniref:Man(5)GlcNAc(2)-PP-dolichol translocation protein RFT1 n=1 Tax=Kwoniella dendrophila CBS 6074 TaxID=1295534 RepID=A0AAX4JXF6_9TREE